MTASLPLAFEVTDPSNPFPAPCTEWPPRLHSRYQHQMGANPISLGGPSAQSEKGVLERVWNPTARPAHRAINREEVKAEIPFKMNATFPSIGSLSRVKS